MLHTPGNCVNATRCDDMSQLQKRHGQYNFAIFILPEFHMSTHHLKRRPLHLLIATLPLWHTLPAVAQTTMPTMPTMPTPVAPAPIAALLGEVVVTSSVDRPLPHNTATLSNAERAARRAATSDVAALLRDVPGVSLYGAGGVSSLPVLHGLADDRVRVQVDGMDIVASCPNHMNPALSTLDPANLGTLKVYAGITPVSVGGDSIGGSIVAETPAPTFATPGQNLLLKGEAGVFWRSNGNAQGGHLSATIASENLSLAYSGATAKADNYQAARDFKSTLTTGRNGHLLPRDEVGSTAYDTRNHTLSLAFRSGDHLIEARAGFQDMPYQNFPNQRMDLTGNTQHRLNLRYQGRYDWGQLAARIYREHVDHAMDFGADKRFWYGSLSGTGAPCAPRRFAGDPAGTCAAGMPMNTTSKTTGGSLKADIALSADDLLRTGFELQRYRLDDFWPASGGGMGPGTFWNLRDGQRDRSALFAEWEKRYNPQWTSLIGARHEQIKASAGNARGYSAMAMAMGGQVTESNAFNARDHERRDGNWDLAALARYSGDATQDIEFGLARKVRAPNLYERYTWSSWPMAATMNNFVGDGNGYVGNLNLKPEVAHTLSATFDWHAADRAWEFKATPYVTRVRDYIDAVRTASFTTSKFNVLSYANQSARLAGLDLSGRLPLASNDYGQFGLKGVVSYVHGQNRDTGSPLYNLMPLNARLTLSHTLGHWDSALEFVAVQQKNDLSILRNEIRTPGYSLVNLRTSTQWQQVRIDLGIDNLFNRAYALPLGGAYLGQGTTMSMNGLPWGVAVPGMGRSIHVGASLKF